VDLVRLPRLSVVALALAALAAVTTLHARADAKQDSTSPDPLTLEVPGFPDAYYYKPRSKAQKGILMYLHGRGGNPYEDCRKGYRGAAH
jgi:poly(3-hydroxybutyrate) depolymerase